MSVTPDSGLIPEPIFRILGPLDLHPRDAAPLAIPPGRHQVVLGALLIEASRLCASTSSSTLFGTTTRPLPSLPRCRSASPACGSAWRCSARQVSGRLIVAHRRWEEVRAAAPMSLDPMPVRIAAPATRLRYDQLHGRRHDRCAAVR